jgi:hypothetical protein
MVPARVLLITFLFTLLSFAVSLLLSILGLAIFAVIVGVRPDMAAAYRHFAFPAAMAIAGVVLVAATVVEVRQYRQAKALSEIARASE